MTYSSDIPFKKAKENFIVDYLNDLLQKTNYNVTKASEKSELPRPYLHRMIKQYNITLP